MDFLSIAKDYPVASGAISVWALGVGTYLCKQLPNSIRTFAKTHLTTSLSITNEDIGENKWVFDAFNSAIVEEKMGNKVKHFSVYGTYYKGENGEYYNLSLGDGSFFLRKGFRLFKVSLKSEVKDNSKRFSQIKFETLGKSPKAIKELFEEFRYKRPKSSLSIQTYSKDGWMLDGTLTRRPLETVMMDKEKKNHLVYAVQKFLDNEKDYVSRGIPYKLVIVLEGPPGTGKTSIIKALSAHFSKSIGCISINGMSDSSLSRALTHSSSDMFVAIEDFDSASAMHERRDKDQEGNEILGVTISGVLNALDGIASLHGKVIFMTTNHIKKIDEAILRKGRTDMIVHVGGVGHDVISEYIMRMYPGFKIPQNITFKKEVGCNVQAAFFESNGDPEKMLDILKG